MKDFLEKGFLMSLGLAALTKEKLDKAVEDLVERGKVSEKEGRELADDLLAKSEDFRKDLSQRVEKMVADTLAGLSVPTREDLQKLEARIAKLEQAGAGRKP